MVPGENKTKQKSTLWFGSAPPESLRSFRNPHVLILIYYLRKQLQA